jgi:hypothetical protein
MSNNLVYPFRITILTLISYAIGLAALDFTIISVVSLFIGLSIIAILNDRLQLFYQTARTLIAFIFTTFVFGMIHSYSFHSVSTFINSR